MSEIWYVHLTSDHIVTEKVLDQFERWRLLSRTKDILALELSPGSVIVDYSSLLVNKTREETESKIKMISQVCY